MQKQKSYKNYVCDKLTFMSAPRLALIFVSGTMMVVGLVTYTVSIAWSAPYESFQSQANKFSPPPTLTDTCFPVLNSVSSVQSDSGFDRRQAGQAAVLGLMLGVQFALSPAVSDPAPHTTNRANSDASLTMAASPRNAPAIAAYRDCQKRQALAALNTYQAQH